MSHKSTLRAIGDSKAEYCTNSEDLMYSLVDMDKFRWMRPQSCDAFKNLFYNETDKRT